MSFNPNLYLIDLRGKSYLPVAARVAWFREQCPIADGWEIHTERMAGGRDEGYATYRCEIRNEGGRSVASAIKTEDAKGFADYEEKAETGSIGRALGLCGFGTLYALEFDEGTERIADAPIERAPERAQPVNTAPPAASRPQETRGSKPRQNREETPPAGKVTRQQLEAGYLEWLERAATLGAVRTHAREFQVFRTFDPSGAIPEKLVEMCKALKAFLHDLETDAAEARQDELELAADAAMAADVDPFTREEVPA